MKIFKMCIFQFLQNFQESVFLNWPSQIPSIKRMLFTILAGRLIFLSSKLFAITIFMVFSCASKFRLEFVNCVHPEISICVNPGWFCTSLFNHIWSRQVQFKKHICLKWVWVMLVIFSMIFATISIGAVCLSFDKLVRINKFFLKFVGR